MARIRKRNNTAIASAVDATPERLAKAGRDGAIEKPETRGSQPVTVLFDRWPLKMLHARGALGKGAEAEIGRMRFENGLRYYEHHFQSGLEPHVSPSYGEGGGCNSWDHSHMAPSERAAWHRQKIRAIRDHLGHRLTAYADYIIIDEIEPAEAARRITGRRDMEACKAVGIEMLKLALDTMEAMGAQARRRRA